MKAQEIRGMTAEEISLKLDELEENLVNLSIQHGNKQLDNPMRLRSVKKDIARLKTILRESRTPSVTPPPVAAPEESKETDISTKGE